MFELISAIFHIIGAIIEMVFGLIGGVISFVFSLFGAILGFSLHLVAIAAIVAVVFLALRDKKGKNQKQQSCPSEQGQRVIEMDDGEEFVSYYAQH